MKINDKLQAIVEAEQELVLDCYLNKPSNYQDEIGAYATANDIIRSKYEGKLTEEEMDAVINDLAEWLCEEE